MKVDLRETIKNFEGEPVREMDSRVASVVLNQSAEIIEDMFGKEKVDEFKEKVMKEILGEKITLGSVIRNVLGGTRGEKEKGEESLKRFNIGLKCVADTVDLSFEERKIIREEVENSGYNRLVYGRICQALSGDEENREDESPEEE